MMSVGSEFSLKYECAENVRTQTYCSKWQCVYLGSTSKVKKNLSSPSSQELVPLTLESVYGTIWTHSSLFAQSDGRRILHFEIRVVLNFR